MASESKSPPVSGKAPLPKGDQPLIAESVLDAPSQRLYVLSLGLLFQAIKVFDFFRYIITSEDASASNYTRKWLLLDFTYCLGLSWLRIPRLRYSKAVVLLHIFALWFTDGILFGGLSMNMSGVSPFSRGFFGRGHFDNTINGAGGSNSHLLGQHTVRMSPISTAHLNPRAHAFCFDAGISTHNGVLVPVLFNNTSPTHIRYSIHPLDANLGRIDHVDLNAKELKAIELARLEAHQLTRVSSRSPDVDDDEDEDDDEDSANVVESPEHPLFGTLQKTQSITYIRVSKPGIIHLERVVDASNVESRIIEPASATVVPCPRAEFVEDAISNGDNVRCAGSSTHEDVYISIYGVPPLSLRWFRDVNGRREHFVVDGIEGSSDHETKQARELRIPLDLNLGEALGSHVYTLESLSDGVGNTLTLSHPTPLRKPPHTQGIAHNINGTVQAHVNVNSKTTRSLTVLKRASFSFRNCGPGNPASLLIGAESPLTIAALDGDILDAPWEVTLKYQPFVDDVPMKRFKPWKKQLRTQKGKKDLSVRANAPGEYSILSIKGSFCPGDVLNPDTCRVEETPYPTAEIEWKRIHECSGDTGVSASLVLHGKPPFQVYYRVQLNDETPRDALKTFQGSRGDITLQPERSGHYSYTFVHLSDANYKLRELKGPSIDQVVHPLAAADFAQTGAKSAGKKSINSCSGSFVDIDIDLRGTGPWNVEVQIIGPHGSETLQFSGLKNSRETLKLPIPKTIDDHGGNFQIDLVSVEDASACKRSLSLPGISVNVRRVKPTVKFYSKDDKRLVTVLEHERASLPLRLTGDGPWRIHYRRAADKGHVYSADLTSPNDQLHVNEEGLYEIIDVRDSQCPGSVVADESTYQVDWIARPSAMLASDTEVTYEPYNGSYIRQPICEGIVDYVDLDLTGRPPFQIMYIVARSSDTGGIKVLDQPTFSSIQPHTRFQLHTAEAGRMYYEVKQIGDTAYPLSKHKEAVIPRSQRLLFEQEVLKRPSARFRNSNRISYCLNDAFTPRDSFSHDGIVMLEGTPPFQLKLSIKNLAAGEVHTEIIETSANHWKIDVASYVFKSVGPHLVTIDSIQDVSHCEQVTPDPLYRSMWVDVAETAAIVPFDRRENFCVGDVTQFQLEGTPPWTVGYKINGKAHSSSAKVSPFSMVQQQPGTFAIVSIAHQQKMCTTAITNLRFTVHPLPSAQVGHGKKIYQDIHEGDQAEIVFTLVGEPPFTFTYQRAEPSPKKGGKPGKVLETHTVSGVTTKEYSIFSALEGTWTVTFISDRYCRYPPTQSDSIVEQSR